MKKLLFFGFLVLLTAQAHASGALVYGRVAYDGSICNGCSSEPQTANLLGYLRWIDIFPLVDFSLGLDYVRTSVSGECGKLTFTDYGVNGSGTLTLFSLGVVKTYAGGGVSYHFLRYSGNECRRRLKENELGYHGLIGLRSTFPLCPVNGFVEGRLSKVGGGGTITMKSLRLGLVISIGG